MRRYDGRFAEYNPVGGAEADGGELTPKLSLERAVVAANYAADIEALYR
ncbi:Uncharacterised protein [Nocardia brasiliensis]|nr:Uncharacterised protein [Nocardia brasiliensis]